MGGYAPTVKAMSWVKKIRADHTNQQLSEKRKKAILMAKTQACHGIAAFGFGTLAGYTGKALLNWRRGQPFSCPAKHKFIVTAATALGFGALWKAQEFKGLEKLAVERKKQQELVLPADRKDTPQDTKQEEAAAADQTPSPQKLIDDARHTAWGEYSHEKANTLLVQLDEALRATPQNQRLDTAYEILHYAQLRQILVYPVLDAIKEYQWLNLQKQYTANPTAETAQAIKRLCEPYQALLAQNKQHYVIKKITDLLENADFKNIIAAAEAKRAEEVAAWEKRRFEASSEGKAAHVRAQHEPAMTAALQAQNALFEPLQKLGAFLNQDNVFAARQKLQLDRQITQATMIFLADVPKLPFINFYNDLKKDIEICKAYANNGSKRMGLSLKNKIDGFAWCQQLMDFDLQLHRFFSDEYLIAWRDYHRYEETVPNELEETKRALEQAELALSIPEENAKNLSRWWTAFDQRVSGRSDYSPYGAAQMVQQLSEQYKKELEAAVQEGNRAAQKYLARLQEREYRRIIERGF